MPMPQTNPAVMLMKLDMFRINLALITPVIE
jgi:hypothetical protein